MFEQFTRENRHILSFAMEEAADLGHTQLGNDHLILGMLCNARAPIFARLAAEGFALDAARETVTSVRGDGTDSADADESQVAEDREALKSVGIDLDKVATAIKNAFGTDITDGWSQRGSERRGRGHRGHRHGGHDRGGHDRGGHGHGGHDRGGRDRGCGGPEFAGHGRFDPEQMGPRDTEDGPWERGRGRRGPRGRGGPFGRPRFSVDAKAAIANAVQIARETGSDRLTAEHVLLGILKTDDARSRALIESVTTPEKLRDAISAAA